MKLRDLKSPTFFFCHQTQNPTRSNLPRPDPCKTVSYTSRPVQTHLPSQQSLACEVLVNNRSQTQGRSLKLSSYALNLTANSGFPHRPAWQHMWQLAMGVKWTVMVKLTHSLAKRMW